MTLPALFLLQSCFPSTYFAGMQATVSFTATDGVVYTSSEATCGAFLKDGVSKADDYNGKLKDECLSANESWDEGTTTLRFADTDATDLYFSVSAGAQIGVIQGDSATLSDATITLIDASTNKAIATYTLSAEDLTCSYDAFDTVTDAAVYLCAPISMTALADYGLIHEGDTLTVNLGIRSRE